MTQRARKDPRVDQAVAWKRQAQVPPGASGGPGWWLDVLATLPRMVRDRAYRFPGKVKAVVILALMYSIWPLDLLPDFFIPLGFLDDVGIVWLALQMLYTEVLRYRGQETPVEVVVEKTDDVDPGR